MLIILSTERQGTAMYYPPLPLSTASGLLKGGVPLSLSAPQHQFWWVALIHVWGWVLPFLCIYYCAARGAIIKLVTVIFLVWNVLCVMNSGMHSCTVIWLDEFLTPNNLKRKITMISCNWSFTWSLWLELKHLKDHISRSWMAIGYRWEAFRKIHW